MLKLSTFCVALFLLVVKFSFIFGYDYCKLEEEQCRKRRHIACKPEQMKEKAAQGGEEWGSDYVLLPMTKKLRKAIVDQHNKVRNELACGKLPDKEGKNYPPAAHMRELIWDIELEHVAREHAKLCVFEHDECRVTSKYEYAGQNLAVRVTSKEEDMMHFARYFVNAWYEEYKLATISDVNEIKGTPGIGHFTQLSNDHVHRLGCAITRCNQTKKLQGHTVTKYLYTCDYSFSNMFGMPVYTNSSSPASNCAFVQSVKSGKYNCLCENSDYELPLG